MFSLVLRFRWLTPMASAMKLMVVVAYSDIPMAGSDGKCNKNNAVLCYSDIPMAYADGKCNKTNVLFVTDPDIPMAGSDGKRNKTNVFSC